jgi:riboflavin synthase
MTLAREAVPGVKSFFVGALHVLVGVGSSIIVSLSPPGGEYALEYTDRPEADESSG